MMAFHGYRSLATIDFALEVEFFHRLGYDVLLPYQRSHGESQGKYITYGVKERFDCRDWARYAARRFGEDKPLFLMGISMGAATVLMASGLELPGNTRGIVADCGFTTPWDIMAHVARRDYSLPRACCGAPLPTGRAGPGGGGVLPQGGGHPPGPGAHPAASAVPPRGEGRLCARLHDRGELCHACACPKAADTVPGAEHAQSFGVDTGGLQGVPPGVFRALWNAALRRGAGQKYFFPAAQIVIAKPHGTW